MEVARDALHRTLELAGRDLDLLSQPAQLVQLHFAIDVGFHLIDVTLQTSEQMSEHPCGLRQAFRPDDDQRHDRDDDDFRESYVEHGMRPIRATRGPSPLREWRAIGHMPAGGAAITLAAMAPCALRLRSSCRRPAAAALPTAGFRRRSRWSSSLP